MSSRPELDLAADRWCQWRQRRRSTSLAPYLSWVPGFSPEVVPGGVVLMGLNPHLDDQNADQTAGLQWTEDGPSEAAIERERRAREEASYYRPHRLLARVLGMCCIGADLYGARTRDAKVLDAHLDPASRTQEARHVSEWLRSAALDVRGVLVTNTRAWMDLRDALGPHADVDLTGRGVLHRADRRHVPLHVVQPLSGNGRLGVAVRHRLMVDFVSAVERNEGADMATPVTDRLAAALRVDP